MSGVASPADDSVPVRRADVEWVELDDEAVLHDPLGQALHRLDRGARAVWVACDGTSPIGQIVRAVQETYVGPRSEIERDVRGVIERFRCLGLLEVPACDLGTDRGGD